MGKQNDQRVNELYNALGKEISGFEKSSVDGPGRDGLGASLIVGLVLGGFVTFIVLLAAWWITQALFDGTMYDTPMTMADAIGFYVAVGLVVGLVYYLGRRHGFANARMEGIDRMSRLYRYADDGLSD